VYKSSTIDSLVRRFRAGARRLGAGRGKTRRPLPPVPSERAQTARLGGVVEGYTFSRPDTNPQRTARRASLDRGEAPYVPEQFGYRESPWVWLSVVVVLLLIGVVLASHFLLLRPVPKAEVALSHPAVEQVPTLPPEPPPERPSPFSDSAPAAPQPESTAKPRQASRARKAEAEVAAKPLEFTLPSPASSPDEAREVTVLTPPPALNHPAVHALATLPAPRRTHWAAVATFEVAKQGTLRHLVRRLPGLRRFEQYKDSGPDFVEPRPLHPIVFVLPEGASPGLVARKQMDVKARLEASGKVSRVELMALPDEQLVTMLSYAANQWEFEPARLKGKPVGTEIILHFRLENR
jgi:hypothetical protein